MIEQLEYKFQTVIRMTIYWIIGFMMFAAIFEIVIFCMILFIMDMLNVPNQWKDSMHGIFHCCSYSTFKKPISDLTRDVLMRINNMCHQLLSYTCIQVSSSPFYFISWCGNFHVVVLSNLTCFWRKKIDKIFKT